MKKPRANIACRQVDIPSPCPVEWKNLPPGQNKKQRLCNSCKETVYLCLSAAESIKNTRLGRLVQRHITIRKLHEKPPIIDKRFASICPAGLMAIQ